MRHKSCRKFFSLLRPIKIWLSLVEVGGWEGGRTRSMYIFDFDTTHSSSNKPWINSFIHHLPAPPPLLFIVSRAPIGPRVRLFGHLVKSKNYSWPKNEMSHINEFKKKSKITTKHLAYIFDIMYILCRV